MTTTRPAESAETRKSLRSWLSRALAPNLGRCYRCKTSLFGPIRNEYHTTWYGSGHGCFPLCEQCWGSLVPRERMPYYDALVDSWVDGIPDERVELEKKRREIFRAVMNGG